MDTLLTALSALVLVATYKLLHHEVESLRKKAKPKKRKRQGQKKGRESF